MSKTTRKKQNKSLEQLAKNLADSYKALYNHMKEEGLNPNQHSVLNGRQLIGVNGILKYDGDLLIPNKPLIEALSRK